ncbi:hypothetical protein BELL_0978g00010 [Botrytis elliptica]|uniref:Uncharacterized protein n=1 Tax=Botrytis elliptica TaxID=278938 RepID=A0A4Z1IXA2_9HELO|nr:hypothetical protein EAE99_004215 [Botrytis elliptica]TGO66089.1 hypothetical protein BELL_0978g00010 [Botrytis elliptica]
MADNTDPDYSFWQEEQEKRLKTEDILARKEQEIPVAGGLRQGSLVSLDMKRDEWAAILKVIVDAINEHGRVIDDAGIQFISNQCIKMREMIVAGHQQAMSYRAKGRVWRGLRNRSEQYILEFRRATQYYFTTQKDTPDQDMDPAIFRTAVADWHAAITTTLRVLREALGEEESQREAEDVEYDSDTQEPVINLRRNHSTPQQFSKLVQEVIEMVELAKNVSGNNNAGSSYDRRVQQEYIKTQEALKEVSQRMEKLERERRDFFLARGTRPPDQDCAREKAEIERLDKELTQCRAKLEELTKQCRQQTEYIDAVARGLKPSSNDPSPGVLLSDQAFDELCRHFDSYHENAEASEARNKELENSLRNVILHPSDNNKQELDKKLRAEIEAANASITTKDRVVADLQREVRKQVLQRQAMGEQAEKYESDLKAMNIEKDRLNAALKAAELKATKIVKIEASGGGVFSNEEKLNLEQQLKDLMDQNMLHEKNIHLCQETIKDLQEDIATRDAKIESLTVMINFDDDITKNRQEKQDLREKVIALEHYIDNELAKLSIDNYVDPDDPDDPPDPDNPKDPKDKAEKAAQRQEIARLKLQLETESKTAKAQIDKLVKQLEEASKTADPEAAKIKKQLAAAIRERHQTLLQTQAERAAAKRETDAALARSEARRLAAEKELHGMLEWSVDQRDKAKRVGDEALARAEARVVAMKKQHEELIAKSEAQRTAAKEESDGIIANLRKTIADLRTQITNLNSVNIGLRTTMQERIDALTKQVAELHGRIPDEDAANGPLAKALDDLENRDLKIALLDEQISDVSKRHEQQIKDIQARLDEARLNANGISPQGLRTLRRNLADCRKNHDDDQITITNLEAELDACQRRGQHQLRQLQEYAGLHQHADGEAAAKERIAQLEVENAAIEEELQAARVEREQKAEEDRKKAAEAHQKELDDAAADVDIDVTSVTSHDSNEEINKQHIERLRRQTEDLKKLKNENLNMEIQLNVSKRTLAALQDQRTDLQNKLRECRRHRQELIDRQSEVEPGAPEVFHDDSQRVAELEARIAELEALLAACEETGATLQLQRDAAIAENDANKQKMADLQTAHDIMAGEGPKLGMKRIKTRISLQAQATKRRNIAAREAQQAADALAKAQAAQAKKDEEQARKDALEQAKKDQEGKPDDHDHNNNQPPPPPPGGGAGASAVPVSGGNNDKDETEEEAKKRKKKEKKERKEERKRKKAESDRKHQEKMAKKFHGVNHPVEKPKTPPSSAKKTPTPAPATGRETRADTKLTPAQKKKKEAELKKLAEQAALTPIPEEEEEESPGSSDADLKPDDDVDPFSDSDNYYQIGGYSSQPQKSSFVSSKPASRPRVTFNEKKYVVEPEIEQEDEGDEMEEDKFWDDFVDLEPAGDEMNTTKGKKSLKRASPLSGTRSGKVKRAKKSKG